MPKRCKLREELKECRRLGQGRSEKGQVSEGQKGGREGGRQQSRRTVGQALSLEDAQ